jgi:Ca2+-binding EF-hand superfamily protein
MKKWITMIAVMTMAMPLVAQAGDDHERKHGHYFERLDLNKDGVIGQKEFLQAAMKRFRRIDANSDGAITEKEMHDFWHARKEAYKKSGEKAED